MASSATGETQHDHIEDMAATEEVKTVAGNGKNSGLKQLLKDRLYRSKVMHTMYLALAFLSLGLFAGQLGPTFLDLQIITGTDLEKASAFFTGGSIGYLVGSVTCGALYSKVNKNFLLLSGMLSMGTMTAITPYCKIYELMIFIRTVCGITAGFVDTTGNSEQMRVWGNEGHGLMQMLHFVFAFGGVISPLYTAPFLSQINTTDCGSNCASPGNNNTISSSLGNNTVNITLDGNPTNSTPGSNSFHQESQVHAAFLITGICAVLSGLPFFIFFLKDLVTKKAEKKKEEEKITQRNLPLPVFLCLLGAICMFYSLYCCVEDTFASFLMTFLVRQYSSVSKAKGAYITAIYWASFAVSRFLMIFVSKFLTPVRLLSLCLILMVIAYTSFIISAVSEAITAVAVFAAMAGLSMSGVFPGGFSWTQAELLRVTGPISSSILVSASLGTMMNPILLAYLMEEHSNMWFCYLLVGETLVLTAIFIFILNFNRRFVNKHYGPLPPLIMESTISVEEQESKMPLSAASNDSNLENHNI